MSQNIDENDIRDDLVDFGLSPNEAKVYLNLLELGEVGTSKIVRGTGLHGQLVYKALDKLENEGLAQHVIVKGRRKYSANNPSTLSLIAEDNLRRAKSISKKIMSSYTLANEQDLRIIKGTDTSITDLFNILRDMEDGSTLYVTSGDDDQFVETMGNSFEQYEYERIKKNISVKYIGSESNRKRLGEKYATRKLFTSRFLPDGFKGNVNQAVYPGSDLVTISLFAENNSYSITIKDKGISESYLTFFETLWNLAT